MKKIISLMLAAMVLSLCLCTSCSRTEQNTALSISGAEISDELYAYYLGTILHQPEDYGLTADSITADAVTAKATELCADYVAINSLFAEKGLRLTSEYKYEIADGVSTKWDFYNNFYSAAGIGKSSLTKALTSDAKRDMLFSEYYDKGGEREVAAEMLRSYFDICYVSFRSINGYLNKLDENGETVALSETELGAIRKKFDTMADDIKTGSSFDSVYLRYSSDSSLASYSEDTLTIRRGNNNYPSDFFDEVFKLEYSQPTVIETENYIFLVVREKQGDSLLDSFKGECLESLCSEDFSKLLVGITATYVVRNGTVSTRSIYNEVKRQF